MSRVRESRHITVDDLHDETKIPLGLLEAFEDTALFDHPQFNRVYLRSFVRTYANVLGIEAEVAIEALEEALSDRYRGSLAVQYLGEEEKASDSAASRETITAAASSEADEPILGARTEADHEAEASKPPDRGRERRADKTPPSSEGEAPPPRKASTPSTADAPPGGESDDLATAGGAESGEDIRRYEASSDEERTSPTLVSTTGEGAAAYEAAKEDETEWTMQSPPRPKEPASTLRAERRKRPDEGGWRWMAGVAAAVVIGVIVWIIISVSGDGTSTTQDVTSVADTASTADTPAVQGPSAASPGPMPVIGDTMNVHIIAVNDKADPVRVTVDDDLRRPYWIEQGDSMLFQPLDRIVIEEDLDNLELSIEGASFPTSRRDDVGRVVITRDSLRAYFGSGEVE